MSILSTNNKIVRVGDAYSAGSGIDITDRVISVSDDLLNEISAISATVSSVTGDIGSQIDYISGAVDNLSGDIDYISANAGRTYSGIDPIVVNNDENKISATTLQLSAGDNITLTEEGNIVRIDGQAGGLTGDYISGSNVSGFSLQNHLGEPYNEGYDIHFTTNAIAGMYLSEYDSASSRQLYLDPEKLMFVENYGTPDQRNETFDANDISALKNSSGYWNEVSSISSTSSVLNNQITAVRNDLNTVSTNTGYLYNDIQTTSGILSAAIDYVSANAGGTSLTGDAQGALDEVYVNSGSWNDISALNNKKDFDVQAPLIIAEETISSLKIGISGISADEWNSVYNTVYTGSGSWTGGGGGSVDTVPFVVLSPLTTGFTGDSAYIGLENAGDDFAKNSAFTFSNSYLTGVSGYKVSAYRTYSAYTARNAYTATNAAYAQTAQTAYYDGNGNYIVALPSIGTLDPTATYSLKWNGTSSYYWSKEGSSPTPTATSLYPIIHYYANQNSSGATISGSNMNISVSCEYGNCDVPTGTGYYDSVNLTAGQTTSFTLNGEIGIQRAVYNNPSTCTYSADNDFIARFYSNNIGSEVLLKIDEIGKYNTINIEGNQVTGGLYIMDSLKDTISAILFEESSTFNNTYTIPASIQGRTVSSIYWNIAYCNDWLSCTATKV